MKRWFMSAGLCMWVLISSAAPLPAQEDTGPRWRVNAAEIEIAGRLQMQMNTTSADAEPGMEMLLRRVRLEARVRVNDLVSGKIQPDFAGDRISLKDAFIRLDFAPQLQLLAGKAHRPFSLIEQVSSTRVLPVERGARIRGVTAADQYALVSGLAYSDRDIGFQLLGGFADVPLRPTYQVGFFAGPLQRQVGSENTGQVAARATIQPVAPLRVGAAFSRRDFARVAPGRASGWELTPGNAFSVDVEYGSFAPGFHLIGEVAVGDAEPFAGDTFRGAQGWFAYRTEPLGRVSAIEPILRASYGSIRHAESVIPDPGGLLLTPGINLYLGGQNRVMVNYDLWSPTADTSSHGSLKVQFQLVF